MATRKSTAKKPSLVEKYLQRVAKKAGGHDCIYRGLPNAEWRSENSAARRIREAIKKEESVENKVGKAVEREAEAEVKNEVEVAVENEAEKMVAEERDVTPPKDSLASHQKSLLDDARQKGFGIRDGRELNDLEMLAELQHFEAATCLLDFTENPLVALYFACANEKEKQKNGKLFILRNANLNTVSENSHIEKIIESGDLLQWRPPMHGEAERRIIRQSGVFIINLNLKEEEEKAEKRLFEIKIARGDKESILKELRNNYQISEETLFIDLAGFAKNQSSEKPLPEALGAFYCGNAKYKEGDFDGAIKHYDKAIEQKPSHVQSYSNRGFAKIGKEDFDAAIEDFNKALRLNPDTVAPYFGRSDVYFNRFSDTSKTEDLLQAQTDAEKALYLAQQQSLSPNLIQGIENLLKDIKKNKKDD